MHHSKLLHVAGSLSGRGRELQNGPWTLKSGRFRQCGIQIIYVTYGKINKA